MLERAVGLGDPPGSAWRAVPCWWDTPCEGSAVDDAGLSRCIKVLKMNHCFFTTCQVYAACVFCALWSHRGNSVLALGTWRRHTQASLTCHRSHLALGLSGFGATGSDLQVWSLSLDQSSSLHASEGDSCLRRWALTRFSEKCRDPCTGIRIGKPLRFGGAFQRVVHRNPSYRS